MRRLLIAYAGQQHGAHESVFLFVALFGHWPFVVGTCLKLLLAAAMLALLFFLTCWPPPLGSP